LSSYWGQVQAYVLFGERCSLIFYREKLDKFIHYCAQNSVENVTDVSPDLLRSYMLQMAEVRGNNKGNIHCFYRCVRAFLYWYENEFEPEGWKNPIKKVKPPRQSNVIIEPVGIDTITAMLDTCTENTFIDDRDAAILLSLLDLGTRATEFLDINLENVDASGVVTIIHGKGDKSRVVFLGKKSRKAIRRYLRHRTDQNPALWIARTGSRLTYDGLRMVLRTRAGLANVKTPAPHGFRRQFALTMLRNDVDVFSLQKLLGHTSLAILRRYLAQNNEDTQLAHLKGSPGDHLF